MSLETVNLHRFPLNAGQRVLDLGCGEGRHAITAYLHADVQVIGLDLSRHDIDIARDRFGDFEEPNHSEQVPRLHHRQRIDPALRRSEL